MRIFLIGLALLAVVGVRAEAKPLLPMAEGPFKPSWESLAQYQAPEWFRDAKFGIWAHWTAQCVPEQGDWYARNMYVPSESAYTNHVANYGHPSKFGFKDIDNLWHAENWNPEKLIALYKRAGAKYFVALANHCDNFDCFDSAYQPWNSVRMGPKKDIVGGWAKAARAAGLRFGVSVHASHAWSWLEPSQGADTEGPLKGVPYDGNLTLADGKGQWWEGLDPQDLYAQNHKPGTCFEWYWDSRKGSSVPDKAYCDKYYNRTVDLIGKYQPDLLYFDDSPIPLWPVSDVGLRLAAHYYNASLRRNGGRSEVVMTGKNLERLQDRCMVHDMERGKMPGIDPLVWQTDSCIGEWHYKRELFDRHAYKKASEVIPMLADIVSKNGNLLLNIPMRGDGTIDADGRAFLEEMAKWMEVNGEAIFSTRPWKVFGEGPSTSADAGKGVSEGQADVSKSSFCAQDIRFTSSKDGMTVYAIALGWPADGKLTVKSLAKKSPNDPGEIGSVKLLGSKEKLAFTRDETGLTVTLPAGKPCEYAYVFKINAATEVAAIPETLAPDLQPITPCFRPKSDKYYQWAMDRHNDLVKQAKVDDIEVAFYGDSLIQFLDDDVWAKEAGPLKGGNFGISSDRVEHLLWRLQHGELEGLKRLKVAVVMIGSNNYGSPSSAASIADGIARVLKTIRKRQPQARILLLGLSPEGWDKDDDARSRIKAINALLADFEARKLCDDYLDWGGVLLNADGSMNRKMSKDGCHYSKSGSEAFFRAVKPAISKCLTESESRK